MTKTKRQGGRRAREEHAPYAYEDEDQSVPVGLRPGVRVRHPKFGEGTVLSIEPLDDDTKLVVRFTSVGHLSTPTSNSWYSLAPSA